MSEPNTNMRTRPRGKPIPAEGDAGLFTESWFPICQSRELKPGQILGRPFLDGRVVAMRSSKGEARVFSAYCPHLGADLAAGKVVNDHIQCGFHHWEFDASGVCDKTAVGDPPPKNACLYKFHVREKFGLIWIFNGDTPWWEIPDYPMPENSLSFATDYDVPTVPVDPWVICANTPDWQHIRSLHKLQFDHELLYDTIEWSPHSMEYNIDAKLDSGSGPSMVGRVGIYGTSMFRFFGEAMGHKFASLTAFHPVAPGETQVYFSLGTPKSDGTADDDERVAMAHAMMFMMAKTIIADDRPILHTIKYAPGTLIKSDRALAKYLELVRQFPRSHHSGDFIK